MGNDTNRLKCDFRPRRCSQSEKKLHFITLYVSKSLHIVISYMKISKTFHVVSDILDPGVGKHYEPFSLI